MIPRTPRVALAGLALALAMAACTSTDADGAVTTDEAVTTAGDAPDATSPTGTEPDAGTAATDAPVVPATTEPATGTDSAAPPEPEPVAVPEALQFSAPLVGGGQFEGAAVADKPTLFWFWAPT